MLLGFFYPFLLLPFFKLQLVIGIFPLYFITMHSKSVTVKTFTTCFLPCPLYKISFTKSWKCLFEGLSRQLSSLTSCSPSSGLDQQLAVGLLLTLGHGLDMALSSQILKTFKGGDAVASLDSLFECCTALLAKGFLPSVQSDSPQPKLTGLPLVILSGITKKSLAFIFITELEVTLGRYWVTTSLLFTTLKRPSSLSRYSQKCAVTRLMALPSFKAF